MQCTWFRCWLAWNIDEVRVLLFGLELQLLKPSKWGWFNASFGTWSFPQAKIPTRARSEEKGTALSSQSLLHIMTAFNLAAGPFHAVQVCVFQTNNLQMWVKVEDVCLETCFNVMDFLNCGNCSHIINWFCVLCLFSSPKCSFQLGFSRY